jgi:hypothetical protein
LTAPWRLYDELKKSVYIRRWSLPAKRRPGEETMNDTEAKRGGWSWWYLLFVIQLIMLWPPLYNSIEPTWMGIPFFYWFQLAMVLVGALFTAIVYFATRD